MYFGKYEILISFCLHLGVFVFGLHSTDCICCVYLHRSWKYLIVFRVKYIQLYPTVHCIHFRKFLTLKTIIVSDTCNCTKKVHLKTISESINVPNTCILLLIFCLLNITKAFLHKRQGRNYLANFGRRRQKLHFWKKTQSFVRFILL